MNNPRNRPTTSNRSSNNLRPIHNPNPKKLKTNSHNPRHRLNLHRLNHKLLSHNHNHKHRLRLKSRRQWLRLFKPWTNTDT
jgi:hypothetical protein